MPLINGLPPVPLAAVVSGGDSQVLFETLREERRDATVDRRMKKALMRFRPSIRIRIKNQLLTASFGEPTQVQVSSPAFADEESDDDDSDMEPEMQSMTMELLHITNMALGHKVKDGARYTVSIESAGTKTVAGTLLPNKIEQCQMDLVFSKEFTVKHTGPTAVHLCGYKAISMMGPSLGDHDDDDDDEERGIFEYGPAGDDDDDDDDEEEPPQLVPARKVHKVRMTASFCPSHNTGRPQIPRCRCGFVDSCF